MKWWLIVSLALPLIGNAQVSGDATSPAEALAANYASKTDQQLTELTANWDNLDVAERTALLFEVKLRMVKNKPENVIRLRTARRYGRIIRQPDGSVLRIERRVVRVENVDPSKAAGGGFGVGFEHRNQQRVQATQDSTNAPRVADAVEDRPSLPVIQANVQKDVKQD